MSNALPTPLPLFDRLLLRAVERVVPRAEREEWSRTWHAELWHVRHRSRSRRGGLSFGLTGDALWLRTEQWRCTFSGTSILCLATLAGLLLIAAVLGMVLAGGWHALTLDLHDAFRRFLVEAPLVVFVAFITASRRHIAYASAGRSDGWIKRKLFFAAKTSLILLFTFLLSADICQPAHASLPNTSEIAQTFFFTVFALIGLRWVFADQEQRCNQCLRSLATPVRVGRPSHNLLEWNGNTLICKQGHGLLSVPEMETSWCSSSQWIDNRHTPGHRQQAYE